MSKACAYRGEYWNPGVRILHWLSAISIAAQIAGMFYLLETSISPAARLSIHGSVGVVILVVVSLRLLLRLLTTAPRRLPTPFARAASLVQASLYVLVIGLLATGWLAYRPVPFAPSARLFGSIPFPRPPAVPGMTSREWIAVHEILVWSFLAVATLHVLAALAHAFVLRDGTLQRMGLGSPSRRAHRLAPPPE
jgi:cytochrome b561